MATLMRCCCAVLLAMAIGCNAANRDTSSDDSAFAGVQDRGHEAMGVDQYTSEHRFEPLADGGRIELQRDNADRAGVATIRAHMRDIADRFSRGDFTIPGFVHAQEVPGTRVMAGRKERITYQANDLPGGAEVRIRSSDSAAVVAVHEFLAFQRTDHRTH